MTRELRDPLARFEIRLLARRVRVIERYLGRRPEMRHRCYLCGDPVAKGSRYCHAHQWAEGGS